MRVFMSDEAETLSAVVEVAGVESGENVVALLFLAAAALDYLVREHPDLMSDEVSVSIPPHFMQKNHAKDAAHETAAPDFSSPFERALHGIFGYSHEPCEFFVTQLERHREPSEALENSSKRGPKHGL